MKLSSSFFILVFCFTLQFVHGGLLAEPAYHPGNGSFYELIDVTLTWPDANAAASSLSYAGRQGHLATITSNEENQFVLNTFSPETLPRGFWMGANDVAVEGEWRWVTGPEAGTLFSLGRTGVGFTFWGSNEPTNWKGIEHYLVFDAEGGSGLPEWDDKPIDYAYSYLVEYSGAKASTVSLAPSLDALADFSDGGSVLVDGGSTINVQNVDFANVDRRGVMEFNISSIPDGSTIVSATLALDIIVKTSSSDSNPILQLHGYSGNGTAEIADGQVPSNLIGQSDPILNLEMINIDIDAEYVESLLSGSDYLGLLAVNNDNYQQAGFVTLEGAIAGSRYAPVLTIEYVPEPATLSILAMGGLALLKCKRTDTRRRL